MQGNKLLKDDIKNKQKLINSILEDNSNLIQAQNVFAQNHSVTRKINDESISHTNTNNILQNDKKGWVKRGDSFKIRPHPGASTKGLINYIKPAIRKNPDIAIIRTGTNDLQNNWNIMKKAKKLASAVKEVDKDKSVKLAFSSIINCEDEYFKDKINNVNNKLKNYCNSAGMVFIENSNIVGSYLNRDNSHGN